MGTPNVSPSQSPPSTEKGARKSLYVGVGYNPLTKSWYARRSVGLRTAFVRTNFKTMEEAEKYYEAEYSRLYNKKPEKRTEFSRSYDIPCRQCMLPVKYFHKRKKFVDKRGQVSWDESLSLHCERCGYGYESKNVSSEWMRQRDVQEDKEYDD